MLGYRAPTRNELLVMAGVLLLFLLCLAPDLCRPGAPEEARRSRCRSNLSLLARGLATYLSEHGDGRWYPFPLGLGTRPDDFNGAEWLASLYWTGIVPAPGIYLCPSSGDRNRRGRDIGAAGAAPTFGSRTVSYASMHYRSLTDADGRPTPGAVPHDFPPNMPMACDDTQGAVNHGPANNGYMSVLFFDTHVEGKTSTEVDLERGVGQKGGLLWRLRN